MEAPLYWSLVVAERHRRPVHRLVRSGGPEEHALFTLISRLRRHWQARAEVRRGLLLAGGGSWP